MAFYGNSSTGGEAAIFTIDDGTFNIIADSTTPIPDTTLSFESFQSPSISNGNVAFKGSVPSGGFYGVYTNANGVLERVVDTSVVIPFGTVNFKNVGDVPSIPYGRVAFDGYHSGQNHYFDGIHVGADHTLPTLITSRALVPGTKTPFCGFNSPQIEQGRIAFRGFETTVGPGGNHGSERGIYVRTPDGLVAVAEKRTPIPGGCGGFSGFSDF